MDRDEAKKVLTRYRPDETDRGDLEMAEALAMVQKDRKLSAWFKKYLQERQWQNETVQAIEAAGEPVAPAKSSRLQTVLMVLLLLGITGLVIWKLLPPSRPNLVADYRDRMARMVQRSHPMKAQMEDLQGASNYFASNGGATGWAIPSGMEDFTTQGATVFTWNNQTVSLLGLKSPQDQVVYLFITPKQSFVDPPPAGTNVVEKVADYSTVTWLNGGYVYTIAGLDEKLLRSFRK